MPSPMSKPERTFLTSVISILIAPKLVALGLKPADQEYAIGAIVFGLPVIYHYGVLYLRAALRALHVPLPEDLDTPNPIQAAPPPFANVEKSK